MLEYNSNTHQYEGDYSGSFLQISEDAYNEAITDYAQEHFGLQYSSDMTQTEWLEATKYCNQTWLWSNYEGME